MYCVVRQYKLKASQEIDPLVETVRSGFLPMVSGQPGFIGYSVAHSEQGDLVTTGFFQDKAAAENSTRLAADWVRDNLAGAVEGPPKVIQGEVRIQERRPGDAGYGALRRVKLQPGKLNEALDLMRDKLVPLLTQISGFVSLAIIEAGPDEAVSLAAWRDRAAAQEATQQAMGFMLSNAAHLIAGPPEMIDAEIKLREVNEAALT